MSHHEPFLRELSCDPLGTAARYYAERLSLSRKAVAFVQDELGMSIEDAISQRVGFSDRTLGPLVPAKQTKEGRRIREQLTSVGLFKPNGREALRGHVTVPIENADGRVIGIRGLRIDRNSSEPSVMVVGSEQGAKKTSEPARNGAESGSDKPEIPRADASPTEAPRPEKPRPEKPRPDSELVVEEGQLSFVRDDRHYRVRGLEKNASLCRLAVNLMVSRDCLVHLDSLDLVKARSRASFIKAAASELYVDEETIKKDIGTLLLKLESLQSDRITELKRPATVTVELSDREREEALQLLRDPDLLTRIVDDLDICGIVGEHTNKLAGYLAATSRKLSQPLAVMIQSSSSAGKTSLMDAILSLMPEEEVQRFSGMTGRSLFYLDSPQIQHKILAIAEDEGLSEATYALKLLQSEGELRHATVCRDEGGNLVTRQHHVEGPVQIFLTTTAMDIDEELINRCFVLSVDETDDQTSAIQAKQRESLTAEFVRCGRQIERIRHLHQNAQRLLQRVEVFNPYATQLTFPTHKTRMRRDHVKYLTLINTVALLHQYQRTIHRVQAKRGGESFQYIEVQPRDIAVANGIAGEVLGRSLDELAPQTRTLLGSLHQYVQREVTKQRIPRSAIRFTRRDLRESIGWSDAQVRKHLGRLVELEYVLVHRGRNGQRYVYELLYAGEGREGQPFLMGLIDPGRLEEPSAEKETLAAKIETLRPEAQTLTP